MELEDSKRATIGRADPYMEEGSRPQVKRKKASRRRNREKKEEKKKKKRREESNNSSLNRLILSSLHTCI